MAFDMAHTIRVGVLQGFSELVEEFSVDPENLLQQCHIDTALIEDEDSRIALNSLLKLLDLSATATGCDHFGLLLASRQESSFLGLVGLLMDSSPDLESAFKKAIRSHSIHAQGTRWRLSTEGEYASASITFDSPVSINPRQAIELAVQKKVLVVVAAWSTALGSMAQGGERPQKVALDVFGTVCQGCVLRPRPQRRHLWGLPLARM